MARVNHKLVKQRLNEQRSKITDRQFFSSRLLAGHFEDLAAAQTKRYHYNRRVRVNLYWEPKEEHIASTDNLFVRINAGNPIVTNVKGRENRYQIVCGLFAHELGHILYTDFLAGQTHSNYLSSYHWYPYPPALKTAADARNEKAFWDYVKADTKNLEMVQFVAHYIANVIEDGYIENRMLSNFPGVLGYGLEKLREKHFEQIATVTQLMEKEEDESRHIFESILQIMLSYAKYGEIKYGDESLSDERIQTVFGLISDIDSALMNYSGKDRLNTVNIILVRCWNYIEDFCEVCKKRQEESETSGSTAGISETISAMMKSVVGTSEIGEGNSTPISEGAETAGELTTASAREKTHEEAQESNADDEEKPSESGETDKALENESCSMSNSSDGAGKQDVSEDEGDRIPHHQSETVYEPHGGTVETNDEYERQQYDRAASDIERILDKMAEKAACEQLENERIRELNEVAQSISYGNIHKGVNIRINRISAVEDDLIEQYDIIAPQLINISRQLQKSLVKHLKEKNRGGKQTGLIMGRRLDSHALCRNDGKVFYKNSLPNEIPQLAVGLLLDESGSMCSRDRCTYARATAIILYDFCQSLNIPITVYGHSTDYETVELYSYAEFESIDRDDKYRMMDIGARSNNRDGAALRFVAEKLAKRPEVIRILFSVSDGQPADIGYTGSAAEEDLRGIKQEYQRKGIIFVAAAIGDDKQNIERIYGDSFLDITDLNQLPVKLTNVVKRHIRV